ncbi:MAG: hypothetical protein J6Y72_06485 [Bacteroidales bacterium]|nr:hypothetical protein [Bacteroidales bacterium]
MKKLLIPIVAAFTMMCATSVDASAAPAEQKTVVVTGSGDTIIVSGDTVVIKKKDGSTIIVTP